jgi:hypothetical protein
VPPRRTEPRHWCSLDAVLLSQRQPVGEPVDPDHSAGAEMARDPGAHLPAGSETEDRDRTAGRDLGVHHRLPGSGQDVGEQQRSQLRHTVVDLHRSEVSLRHPHVLRLGAGHPAIHVGEAEQRGALAAVEVLRGLALAVELAREHEAEPQEMLNGTTTRSPGLMWVTAEPTSSTTPIGSCPRTSPGFIAMAAPLS